MSQPFHKTIGIIGGGQLGKMLIESTQKWNVEYNILDASGSPAQKYANQFVEGKLTDIQKIKELSSKSDVITYEIEHINADALIELEDDGKKIIPSPRVLKIIQNKGEQKDFYGKGNLPTAKYIRLDVGDIDKRLKEIAQLKGNQVVIKSCTGGYDGKGVHICHKNRVTSTLISEIFQGDIIIEAFIENAIELSVIVARDKDGNTKTYPIVEMVFDPAINLVDYLFAPASLSNTLQNLVQKVSIEAVTILNGVGIFAVELFLTSKNEILINEIAPRPHNSGHHTIEACYTSQYEQLARILLEMPLGETTLLSPCVMTNVVGPEGLSGSYTLSGMEMLFSTPGASLHWYNKSETRPGRKMGHFTVMNPSLEKAIELSKNIKHTLKIVEPQNRS